MAPEKAREMAPPARTIREPLSTIADTPIIPRTSKSARPRGTMIIAAQARIVPCASQWSGELPSAESARPIQIREPLGTMAAFDAAPIIRPTSQCFGTQTHQQQNALVDSYRSAALEFMWLVKTTVTSREEYEAFQQVMRDFSRRSLNGGGDANAIKFDTILSIEELLQNYPLLITGFRAFRALL